jgi:L-malate glycosyltransferase
VGSPGSPAAGESLAMLTVLLATRNGARTLPEVLTAYCTLETPSGGWKLVIVDNGSTDTTKAILASFTRQLPLTYVFEPVPGKNRALNVAIPLITGDLVVFTDDDAVPRADWLVRMREAASQHPSYSIFGGAVVPRWEVPPPQWILQWVPLGPTYSLTPPALRIGPTTPNTVFGPNMSVRAHIFESGHRFDESIGPSGPKYAMGSESELVRRLVRKGMTAWHVHDSVVEHLIDKSHMDRSWILQRAICYGRGQYRLQSHTVPFSRLAWLRGRRQMYRKMGEVLVRMIRAILAGSNARLFEARWELNYLRGQIIEARNPHVTEQGADWQPPGQAREVSPSIPSAGNDSV